MILEFLINPIKAENKPYDLILYGLIYTLLGALLGWTLFKGQASMVIVFLVVLASVPLIIGIIKNEEKKDVGDFNEVALLKEHGKALSAFMFLFLGITLAVAGMYVLLPAETVSTLFSSQVSTISGLEHSIGGDITAKVVDSFTKFLGVFTNNMFVLVYCLLFSLLYGAGAIFILTWNATVIGVAIGNFIRSNIANVVNMFGFVSWAQYFNIVSIGLLKYVVHGVPEIAAYFVAGLAGGIISIAVIRHDFRGRKFEHVLLDSADLLLVAIVLLFVSAVLEIWVTPLIF